MKEADREVKRQRLFCERQRETRTDSNRQVVGKIDAQVKRKKILIGSDA